MADLLQGLKDAVANERGSGSDEDPAAAIGKLLKALNDMPGLTEEDKAELVKGLSQGGLGGLGGLGGKPPIGAAISNPWLEFATLFGLISFIILLLGFIGYKLYNNMVQRERTKEMKKMRKTQKKRKMY
ncbi:unnamed protein product [Ceutorhynchus assimilis]|uniref:Uncharacterized protein n=1 Tax=Ceutorhynchus assimilis TaxID=467358 RepID=A0A9N9M9M4_9CUCU|nr:unnamed protein product [Ceutorhynchus assimilis]